MTRLTYRVTTTRYTEVPMLLTPRTVLVNSRFENYSLPHSVTLSQHPRTSATTVTLFTSNSNTKPYPSFIKDVDLYLDPLYCKIYKLVFKKPPAPHAKLYQPFSDQFKQQFHTIVPSHQATSQPVRRTVFALHIEISLLVIRDFILRQQTKTEY